MCASLPLEFSEIRDMAFLFHIVGFLIHSLDKISTAIPAKCRGIMNIETQRKRSQAGDSSTKCTTFSTNATTVS